MFGRYSCKRPTTPTAFRYPPTSRQWQRHRTVGAAIRGSPPAVPAWLPLGRRLVGSGSRGGESGTIAPLPPPPCQGHRFRFRRGGGHRLLRLHFSSCPLCCSGVQRGRRRGGKVGKRLLQLCHRRHRRWRPSGQTPIAAAASATATRGSHTSTAAADATIAPATADCCGCRRHQRAAQGLVDAAKGAPRGGDGVVKVNGRRGRCRRRGHRRGHCRWRCHPLHGNVHSGGSGGGRGGGMEWARRLHALHSARHAEKMRGEGGRG